MPNFDHLIPSFSQNVISFLFPIFTIIPFQYLYYSQQISIFSKPSYL